MKRRTLLKQLGVATTAALILPSCFSDPKKVSIALSNLEVNGDDEELLGLVAETLIPETDTPGARSVGGHLFTFVMVDDCMDKPGKQKFVSGLRSFDSKCKEIAGKSFSKANAEERVQILKDIEKSKDRLDEDTRIFYATAKNYIIEGYASSQHFLTNIKKYELVPGPNFKGCAPVTENQKPV
jgi:hypothetical protein